MTQADLHIHSDFSDGSDTINELIEKISITNVKIFALTDHDTIKGCEEIKNLMLNCLKRWHLMI